MAYKEARLLYATDNRDLNYDKYFKEGDVKRAEIEEFNSDFHLFLHQVHP